MVSDRPRRSPSGWMPSGRRRRWWRLGLVLPMVLLALLGTSLPAAAVGPTPAQAPPTATAAHAQASARPAASTTSGLVAPPFHQCPPIEADTSCGILIAVTNAGASLLFDPAQAPYDGRASTLIGVQNLSTTMVRSMLLRSSNPIFDFDGDGPCTLLGCTYGPTGYEGPGVSFSSISADHRSGAVTFPNGLAPGASTYFALEDVLSAAGNLVVVQDFKDADPTWAGARVWGDTRSPPADCMTLADGGDSLAALSDVLGTYGWTPPGFSGSLDPQSLGSFLRASQTDSHGTLDCGPVWAELGNAVGLVPRVAMPQTDLWARRPGDGSDPGKPTRKEFIDHAITAGDLPIVTIYEPASPTKLHFVLLYAGQDTSARYSDGTPNYADYQFVDPNGSSGKQLFATFGSPDSLAPDSHGTLAPLSANYLEVIDFPNNVHLGSFWALRSQSPVQFLITGPTGARTGFDPSTGTYLSGIPGSTYGIEPANGHVPPLEPGSLGPGAADNAYFQVIGPPAGQYTVQVVGTASGAYAFDFAVGSGSGGPALRTLGGTTQPGQVDVYTVTVSGPGNGTIHAQDVQLLAQPQRVADTRTGGGAIQSGTSRCFVVAGLDGVPGDASAVLLNVTAVGQTTNGWLTVYPNGQAVPPTSTLNFGPSEYAMANDAIMRVGTGGQVCVNVGTPNNTPGSAHVILDATGYLTSTAPSDVVMLAAPVRLDDTRTDGGALATGTSRCFQVAGRAGIPLDAGAAVLNVTAVGYPTNGWLTVYPAGQPVPSTSTLNFDRSEYAMANGTIMRLGNGGQMCVGVGTVSSAPGSAQVVLDATGYFTADALGQLPMLDSPQRLADTRVAGGLVSSGSSRCFTLAGLGGVPSNATGVILNVTAVGYGTQGWLTVYPAGQPVPATSTLNFDPSEYAMANGTLVALGTSGQVCTNVGTPNGVPGAAQVVLDVVGYLAP